MALSVTDKYTDIAAADAYLILKDDWLSVSDEKKNEALLEARYFIDENFDMSSVTDVSDLTLIEDALQLSSALLAHDFIVDGDLFNRHNVKTVKEQSVQAGSVKSSKKFVSGKSNYQPKSYAKVKVLLSPLYTLNDGVSFLMRA